MEFNFTVTREYDGHTIREILRREFGMSGIMIKNIKLRGRLDVNGVHMRVIDHVSIGDRIVAAYDDDAGKLRSDSGIEIFYEDEYLAVCNKPSGVVTHPTHGHLDDSLLTRLSGNTLHPVMRLDRETSGLIVIAKNGYIHNAMISSAISKKYIAVVFGSYESLAGVIDLPIKRREGSVMIRDVASPDDPSGKSSVTCYRQLFYNSSDNISLVEFILKTGRCHQIRVHSRYMGHPLVGDGLYGPNSTDNPNYEFINSARLDSRIGRQALHAYSLKFTHPVTGDEMSFLSSIPDDMLRLLPQFTPETSDQLLREVDGLLPVGS